MIDLLIDHAQQMMQSQMLHMLRVSQNAASKDIDFNTDQVYDTLIGNISPQTLWSAVIGQYNNVIMNVS